MDLEGGEALDKFRKEYNKLYTALKASHNNEKQLLQTCRNMKAEILSNGAKVTQALKMSQDDKTTVERMKSEVDKAWKAVQSAHEKETRARETVVHLKEEIENLTKLAEHGAGLTMGQENR